MSAALHCDGPTCQAWTFGLNDGWWQVIRIGSPKGKAHDFCSPNCLAAWVASQPWTEEAR